MGNALELLGRQLVEIWKHFGINQKVNTILALLVVIASISGMVYWSSRPSYRLLYSGMTLEDAARAREKLEDEKIPVQLKESGTAIFVPAADVYRCRLMLASDGIMKGTTAGFELFEEPKFGLTDFAQQVNYRRALEGELARTIMSLDGIVSAKVNLGLPEKKIFSSEDEKPATAAIFLEVSGGADMAPSQVASIRQLVAGSVPDLNAGNITISDQHGKLLAKGSGGADDMGMEAANEQLEAQVRLETLLAQKAQTMLDKALGEDKSVVRVSALVDFSEVEQFKETIDSAGRVVVSETISSENTSTPVSGGNSGGTGSLTVGNPSGGAGQASTKKKEDISTQYQVPKGTTRTVEKGARVKNLSVSVAVAQGENPRTGEQMTALTNMVSTAVGIINDGTRMDEIEVVEMVFPTKPEPEKEAWYKTLPIPLGAIGNGVAALGLLIAVFVMSRRVIANLSVEREEIGMPVAGMMPVGVAEGGAAGMVPPTPMNSNELQAEIETITKIAEQNPNAVAAWITSVSKQPGVSNG